MGLVRGMTLRCQQGRGQGSTLKKKQKQKQKRYQDHLSDSERNGFRAGWICCPGRSSTCSLPQSWLTLRSRW